MTSRGLSPSLRAAFVRLIEQRFGLRLRGSTPAQLDAIVPQLLDTSPCANAGELFEALSAGLLPHLLDVFAARLTVHETTSFRATPEIDAVRDVVLPELLAQHATDRRLRLWSAGCSTGEEAYTLAMLVLDRLPDPETWDVQLVASDVNLAALDLAQAGLYGEWSFCDAASDLQARYFTRSGRRWHISDEVRNMVSFVQHNLASDAIPFAAGVAALDLIVCRTVTRHFHELATHRLYQRLARALKPSGWLILGPGDPVPLPALDLELMAAEGALLWRRYQATARLAPARPRAPSAPVQPTPIRRERL
jgi:chemotaxis protein methyltransferase CheR